MEDGKKIRTCRVCGCTDEDCSACIELTGEACHWLGEDEDLCSACAGKSQSIEKQDGDDDDDDDDGDNDDEGDICDLRESSAVVENGFEKFFDHLYTAVGNNRDRLAVVEVTISALEKRIERVAVLLAEHLEAHEQRDRLNDPTVSEVVKLCMAVREHVMEHHGGNVAEVLGPEKVDTDHGGEVGE